MPSKHHPMKLSREEELFLRHWIYDEAHYLNGVGDAKRLQVEHKVTSADLAVIIAASIPDPLEQLNAASTRSNSTPPNWPWPNETFLIRLDEARTALGVFA